MGALCRRCPCAQPAQETRFPIFFEGNYGREPLHVYLMALSVFFLGATPFAIRAVPAAAGVLAVLTTFLAARALLGSRSRKWLRIPGPTFGRSDDGHLVSGGSF